MQAIQTTSTIQTPRPQPLAIDPTKPVKMDVEYWRPIFVNSHLGGTPTDFFSTSPNPQDGPYVSCTPEKCGALPNEVYQNEPLLQPDGTPQLRRYVKHIEDAPASPMNAGILWGTVGAASLGTVGLLVGSVFGMPIIAGLAGTLIGGAAAGAIGARQASGDRIKLQWTIYPIIRTDYVGYQEQIKPATQDGQQGYTHHFVPSFKSQQIGLYKVPSLVHYKDQKPTNAH